MPIDLTLNVSLPGGGTVNATDTLEVAAYDRISEEIPNDGSTVALNLQPQVPGTLRFLAIWSSVYGKELTYRVNSADADPLPLERVQVFSGPPALLVADPLYRLYFRNELADEAAVIDVLIGREAVAPTEAPPPAGREDTPPAGEDEEPASDAPEAEATAPAVPGTAEGAPVAPAAPTAHEAVPTTPADAPAAAGTAAATPAAPVAPGPGAAAPETGAAAPEPSPPGAERR
jgi:hypothetical protein